VTVQGARGIVSDTGGSHADSEVESQIVRSFLLDASAVIFYHSNAGDVFPAFCEHGPSIALAQAYAQAGEYRYDRYWGNYAITGGMHDWAASMGIAAIIPELVSPTDPEYEQNLAAVQAVLGRAEELLPLPEAHTEQGLLVDPFIWRYWQMYGGLNRFGPPLASPIHEGALIRQVFLNAVFEVHPDQADTPAFVQPVALGQFVIPGATAQFAPIPDDAERVEATGKQVFGAFAAYWGQVGAELLGNPLSNEYTDRAADGRLHSIQIFERAVLVYNDQAQAVYLEPLGWSALIRERVTAATLPNQIR
jgi:hypothetical protein